MSKLFEAIYYEKLKEDWPWKKQQQNNVQQQQQNNQQPQVNQQQGEKEWFFKNDGEQFGPHNITVIKNRLKSGMSGDTKVWKQGMANWQKASEIEEFAPAIQQGEPQRQQNEKYQQQPPDENVENTQQEQQDQNQNQPEEQNNEQSNQNNNSDSSGSCDENDPAQVSKQVQNFTGRVYKLEQKIGQSTNVKESKLFEAIYRNR